MEHLDARLIRARFDMRFELKSLNCVTVSNSIRPFRTRFDIRFELDLMFEQHKLFRNVIRVHVDCGAALSSTVRNRRQIEIENNIKSSLKRQIDLKTDLCPDATLSSNRTQTANYQILRPPLCGGAPS